MIGLVYLGVASVVVFLVVFKLIAKEPWPWE